MVQAARPLPSFAALYRRILELPKGTTGEILERGVLRTMGRPGRSRRGAARRALRSLDGFDQNVGGSGWWIEVEAEIRLLSEYLVVPDLASWRVATTAELPDENPIETTPDWVCEILSPSTARDDRRLKLPLYASAGVAWIWLLDPDARQVEIYETVRGRATFSFAEAESKNALPPFDTSFDVPSWFDAPLPRRTAAVKKKRKASPRR